MKDVLNITNGDCAVAVMMAANIPGTFLPWRDVLHDGPVPAERSLEQLSEVRAKFISDRGWGNLKAIRDSFIARDDVLKSFGKYEKVRLWFEHDLYDQLQILQILDWFHTNGTQTTPLSIICTDRYLGALQSAEIEPLLGYGEPITDRHLGLARHAWAAFRSNTPEEWRALLNIDTSVLPFLEAAIIRLLEEYPAITSGLSRTAQQTLKIVAQGEKRPGKVFALNQEAEESRFLGDSSFWVILQELLTPTLPLLKLPKGMDLALPPGPEVELTLTQAGEEVLAGKRNWLDCGKIDRWIGGVHLIPENLWCWDSTSRSIVKR